MTYFLDLFSGIGGFALGAYNAGLRFDKHYFSEVNDYATAVYQKRFPDAIPLGDIRNIHGECLPEGEKIIAGGFPCQDISILGKNAGLEGSRSGLWFEYARLIRELRPAFAIMENVKILTSRGLDRVLGSLAEIGYNAEWQDIWASDLGAPHARQRIYIVAYPGNVGWDMESKIRVYKESRGRVFTKWEKDLFNTSRGDFIKLQATNERFICGMDDGVPHRMDRLKCCGNAIIPQIAELIFSAPAFDSWRYT